MFSSHPTTKAIIKTSRLDQNNILAGEFYNLPKNKILYVRQNLQENTTTLQIFSIYHLEKCLAEKTYTNRHDVLGIFPDGSILINAETAMENMQLLKRCAGGTLDIVSSQIWEGAYHAGIIDNNRFFVISSKSNGVDALSIYQWQGGKFEVSSTSEIKYPFNTIFARMVSRINKLGENRFCFQYSATAYPYGISIFEIDTVTNTVNVVNGIAPVVFGNYGKYVVMPNNKILIYSSQNDYVRILEFGSASTPWKEWRLNIIKKQIIPFPDCLHLLIVNEASICLFNVDTSVLKKIELPFKVRCTACFHVAADGQVVYCDYNGAGIEMIVFDLKEIKCHRDSFVKCKNIVRFFFNQQGFPAEITNHIFSYAFTPDAQQQLAKTVSDENEQKKSNCICM